MRSEYDFKKAARGRFRDRVPPGAVFVRFDARISALFDSTGDLATRLRAAGRGASRMNRLVALSPDEFDRLRPILNKLGAKVMGEPRRRTRRKAG